MRMRSLILSLAAMLTMSLTAFAQNGTATAGNGTSSAAMNTGAAAGGGGSAVGNAAININQGSGLITPLPIAAIQNTGLSTTTIPNSANTFANTYVNPYSLGQPSNFATNLGPPTTYTGTMGKGLYLSAPTTTTSTAASTTTNSGNGFNTMPTPRAPAYITVLGGKLKPRVVPQRELSTDLKAKIANSLSFKDNKDIHVEVGANGLVTLTGQVADEDERNRAEGLIRLTRGVDDVKNELRIAGTARN